MKSKIVLCFLGISFFIALSSYSQEFGKHKINGNIRFTKVDDFLTLRAQVLNEESFFIDELDYNFVALKRSNSGNLSKTNQANDFSLNPNEEKHLATIKINLKEKEKLRVYLFIKHKNKLISRDTLFFENRKSAHKKSVKEEAFLIRGIVLDEAMTKIGKDFHDLFYREYLVTGKNYPFIIKIVEKPAMGRSSILSVEVDRKKIHEFFTKPEEDYLKINVVRAMRNLREYNKNRKSTFQTKI